MSRPNCVTCRTDFEGERRPRFLPAKGMGATVWEVSKRAGLGQMGVSIRAIDAGCSGTHRHFHDVEEEWSFVLSGRGVVRVGPHRIDVRPGMFVGFPPGPRPHHFIAHDGVPLVLLEGGERRRAEDSCFYPDLEKAALPGKKFVDLSAALPAELGDKAQCLHVDDLPTKRFKHEVDARAKREYRTLSAPTGLVRQVVRWSRVRARDLSTAYHAHDRTDEWVYVLEGRARVRVGGHAFEVSAGDFIAHPAAGPPHDMQPFRDLVYLMGGQSDPADVVTYPEAGKRRVGGRI